MSRRGTNTTDDHSPAAIRLRLGRRTRHSYLSDFIYGGIDGSVTTFAIVSGVAAREDDAAQIDDHPDGEAEEIRQIYAAKGLSGDALEAVVDAITADRERWIDSMITEEHGLPLDLRSPWRAAAMTLTAFVVVSAIPLIPFVADLAGVQFDRPFLLSTALVAVAMFAVGVMKSRFVQQRWWLGGLESLAIGGHAAALACAIGALLAHITGV